MISNFRLSMEESAILRYYEGKTIFITGATGFLAKILVEKIVRVQPNVKKLYLLIRDTTERSAKQRLEEELMNCELFQVVREKYGQDFNSVILPKLVPISGDVSDEENLGIHNSQQREEMCQEIDIIVHSAATTRFDERYDVTFGTNVLGTKNVQDFATKCPKLETLLHVSTSFVQGSKDGFIPERLFSMGETLKGSKFPHLDIKAEQNIIQETLHILQNDKNATEKDITKAMRILGIERANLHGWPNTYTFTKAMGEMLFDTFNEKINAIIIRPPIITSTYKEPFPGWIEGLRTLDSVLVAYGKGQLTFFLGDSESIADMMPGDMVINCMLATIALSQTIIDNQQRELCVYQIGSSLRNPIKYEKIYQLMRRYLTKTPFLDHNTGRPIKIGKYTTLNSMASFRNYIARRYLPFLKVLKFANIVFFNCFESQYSRARRSLNRISRLAEIYSPYLFFKGIFDDTNTEILRRAIRGISKNNNNNNTEKWLNFDPAEIEWEEYFLNIHFPGVVKYVVKY